MQLGPLPAELQSLAIKRQIEQGNPENIELLGNDQRHGGFDWLGTPEQSKWYSMFLPYIINTELAKEKEDDGIFQ